MIRLFIVILYIGYLLVGCHTIEAPRVYDNNLLHMYGDFVREAKKRGVTLPEQPPINVIVFADTIDDDLETVGTCFTTTHSVLTKELPFIKRVVHRSIFIHTYAKKSADYTRFVLYHEFGHCILHMHHDDDILLMRAYIIYTDILDLDYALDQLFDKYKEINGL